MLYGQIVPESSVGNVNKNKIKYQEIIVSHEIRVYTALIWQNMVSQEDKFIKHSFGWSSY